MTKRRVLAWALLAAMFAMSGCRPPVQAPPPEPAIPPAGKPPPAREARPTVRSAEAAPDQDLYYDDSNPDFATLQKANQGLAGFPLDPTGRIDWVDALRAGRIQPRADLRGEEAMSVLDLDIVMKNTKEMPWVLFPHRSHTLWLDCSNCHPQPFEARAGAHLITMNDIFRGRYCGTCHDRVAFVTYFSCERCHSVAHGTMKPWSPVPAPGAGRP
jgi:c(7)-type cytochrome triheme protein